MKERQVQSTQDFILGNLDGGETLVELLQYRFINQVQCQDNTLSPSLYPKWPMLNPKQTSRENDKMVYKWLQYDSYLYKSMAL